MDLVPHPELAPRLILDVGREPNYPQYGQQPPASAPTPNLNMMSPAPTQGLQALQQQNRAALSPPQSSTPQPQSVTPNPVASSQSVSSSMPNPASTSAAPSSKPAVQPSKPVFKTPYPPQHNPANSTPQRPQLQQTKMTTSEPSPPATTDSTQSPPIAAHTKTTATEQDTARINALFKINSLICRELIKLQEQGLAGPEYQDPRGPKNQSNSTSSPPNNAANPSSKRPPLFNDYLRRFQSNLAFLDTFRTRPINPPNTIYPIRPPIMDVGPSEALAPGAEAEDVREAFRDARKLWTKEELEGPPYPPGYQEQMERAKQQQMQMMQAQAQAQAQMHAMKQRGQMMGMSQGQAQQQQMLMTQGMMGQARGGALGRFVGAGNVTAGGGPVAAPPMTNGVTAGATTNVGTASAMGTASS